MLQTFVTREFEEEVRALRAEQQIVDALLRFAAGQDLRQPKLFLSAFTVDAQLDFVQPARRFHAEIPIMIGRDAIAGILRTLEPLQTTHTVTNPRVKLHGEHASLSALVEAQHVSRTEPWRYLLLKNVYNVQLVRGATDWRIRSMVIRNLWFDGDPALLFVAQQEAP